MTAQMAMLGGSNNLLFDQNNGTMSNQLTMQAILNTKVRGGIESDASLEQLPAPKRTKKITLHINN